MKRISRMPITFTTLLQRIALGVALIVALTGLTTAKQPDAKHIEAYKAALAEEQIRNKQLELMNGVSKSGNRLFSISLQYEQNVISTKAKSARIHDTLISMADLGARQSRNTQAAKRAIDEFLAAATTARNAAIAFASAEPQQQSELARQADAAAENKARTRALALEAVSLANETSNQLRHNHDSLSHQQRELEQAMTNLSQTEAELGEQVQRFTSTVSDVGGKVPDLSRLQVRAAETKGVIEKIQKKQKDVMSNLIVLPELAQNLKSLSQPGLQTSGPTQNYYRAVFNTMIEADAHAFVMKVRNASDPEIIESVRRVNLKEAEEKRSYDAIEMLIERSKNNLQILKPVIEKVAVDLQGIDALATAGETELKKSIKRLQASTYEAHKKTRQAYWDARKTADRAYIKAYGKPRKELEVREEAAESGSWLGSGSESAMQKRGLQLVITTHAWEFFTAIDGESKNFGAYTYVLFGHRVDRRLGQDVRNRYLALLDAIQTPTPHRTELPDSIDRKKVNLFCIPGKKTWKESQSLHERDNGQASLDNYDSSVSFAYLLTAGNGAVVSQDILTRLRNSPGPFLLTTISPLNEVKTYSPMFFVDLSNFHPDTYREIVTSYKRALVEDPPKEQEQWEPSTLQWVALSSYDVATHLTEVKAAVESWLKAGEDKPVKVAMY